MKFQKLIKQMTVEEKAAFLSGKGEWHTRNIDRLGIPSLFFADGPSGVRKQAGAGDHLGLNPSVPATCFPSAAAVANSWDEKLGEEIGQAIGEEAVKASVNVLLGPGLNIKRSPLCGRSFEYFSEDPYLTGKMAAAVIRGIQHNDVAACAKHYAVNSQESRRMAMNSVIDERTLREIYLTGFEIAVKEGHVKTIMTSYNQVNGEYANENPHLLKDILRDEWGFEGAVITDWGGSNDHVLGVKCGSALEMPNPGLDSARQLLAALESGDITEQDIDERVDELLCLIYDLMERKAEERKAEIAAEDFETMQRRHHLLAKRAAAESMVLLKNDDGILPLQPGAQIAVIGNFAFYPRYQGAGSSMVNATQIDTVENLINEYDLQIVGMERGYRRDGRTDEELGRAAVEIAKRADIVLYFFGLNEQSELEGADRKHLRIPGNQISVLQEIAKVNKNIIGILSGGAVIEMPWHLCLKGLLHTCLAGQAGAGAVLDILTGKVNPSGKLSETYPEKYEDIPCCQYYPAREKTSEYREGIFVGYRYFDTAGIPVLFPFGHGLSYTAFEYSKISVNEEGVSFLLKNIGRYDGAETAQLYVGLPDGKVFRPARELKGFKKVFLKSGEETRVEILFDDKTFRYWNDKTNRWEMEDGIYNLMIGRNVKDICLSAAICVEGTEVSCPYDKGRLLSYYEGRIQDVSDAEYEILLGQPIPEGRWSRELTVNDTLGQMYYANSALARLVCKILQNKIKKAEEKKELDLNVLFQFNMPFRAIAKMTEGLVSMEMVQGLVEAVNGHLGVGIQKVIKGFFANRKLNREYEKLLEEQDRQEEASGVTLL